MENKNNEEIKKYEINNDEVKIFGVKLTRDEAIRYSFFTLCVMVGAMLGIFISKIFFGV